MTERDRLLRRLNRNLDAALDPSLPGPTRKRRARNAAHFAERLGVIRRSPVCQACGRDDVLEKHHTDYDRPLSIVWLCPDCHRVADQKVDGEHLDSDDGWAA